MASKEILYIIGYNAEGDCGIPGDKTIISELTPCTNPEITRVFNGYSQSLYANNDLTKIWSAGFNSKGQCGVGIRYKDKTRLLCVNYSLTFGNGL